MELTRVGKFEIVGKVGQGAMGEVFRALDPVLGREVAIKVVSGKLNEDEKSRDRFLREAQAAAQLNHPNIVTVYDFGEEQGQAYMAMELLEGQDLREMLAKGTLTRLEDKLAIMEQVLDGLAFAHSKGVVHRDLKPGNVHVLPSGQTKVMDFGLARRADDAAATGVMGTPYYMAPEQIQGERATTRSDVFSLGAMFYEVLSGRRPFTGSTIPAVLFAVAHKDAPPLAECAPGLPPGFACLVTRALSKDPRARYADAGEMLEALRVAWAGGQVDAAPAAGSADATDTSPARALGTALSTSPDTTPEMRAALGEIEEYLADRVPPLMVADSVGAFAEAPVEAAAAEIAGWAERQARLAPELPLVDLLFHALHKLGVIGEFHLVEKEKLIGFLRAVGEEIAAACPPGEDRDRFRRALERLGESDMVRTGPLETLSRPAEAPFEVVVPATPGLRRLTVLEQRLRREGAARGPAAEVVRRRVASQAIAAAAREARSEKELEDHLRRLRSAGVASGAEQVFRNLGQELGDWAVPKKAVDTAALGPADEVQAMDKIVSLPEDHIEVARRYRYLVGAATEQFNEGNLGRAVQMFDLAARIAAGKKIDPGFVEPILRKGHESLDPARLRQYMDKPDRHEQLRSVMGFFANGLGPDVLLGQLETEERRDRRRLLLDLLVVHGDAARALASVRLRESMEKPASDYGRRNWIYLLRHVPRPPGAAADDDEVEAVARLASPGNPSFLVKEALLYLGQVHDPRAAEVLASLLGAWEADLEQKDLDEAAREEGLAALDRLASVLARQGGPGAWRALVDHALSGRPALGDTAARLAELGAHDLARAPEVVSTLVHEVRASLPRGVLGRLVSRKDHDLPALVGALAGTRTPAVRALLDEVRRRCPGQEAGKAAARALETPAPAPPAVPGHSGELDAYGLPALLHRLAQRKATGRLNLLPKEGAGAPATIGLSQGRPVSARWAHREGAAAVYQLFERPFPGGYAFDPGAVPPAGGGDIPELGVLLTEGVRRARALQRTSAVVPEDLPLEATGEAPGTVVDEPEYDLVVALWEKACARVCARQMEAEISADAFRIRRPLAQWLEEGALRIAAPDEPPEGPSSPAPGT